jgi:hypothetical protein
MVIAALVSALFSIFGFVLVIYPKWLQVECDVQNRVARRHEDGFSTVSQEDCKVYSGRVETDGMVIAALVSALFSIFGFVLVIYPKWLQENCAARWQYSPLMRERSCSRRFECTRSKTERRSSLVATLGVSALFSIFGFVLVIYPKWLQENCAARFYYGCIQNVAPVKKLEGCLKPVDAAGNPAPNERTVMLTTILLRVHSNRREHDRSLIRGWIASRVHGFQTSFEFFIL